VQFKISTHCFKVNKFKSLFMSHFTSELVNDSVACCVLYGTLLSVLLLSQMVITICSRPLFIRPVDLCIVLSGYCVFQV